MKKFFRILVALWLIDWLIVIFVFFSIAIIQGMDSKPPKSLMAWMDFSLAYSVVLGLLFVIIYFTDIWKFLKDYINDKL